MSSRKKREEFLSRFPIDRVKRLSLEEYAYVGKTDGDSHSFCTIIHLKMQTIAHRRNVRTDIFGIYYRKGWELTLSRTYRKIFGDDFDKAFEQIKSDIYELLNGVENDNYTVVEKSHLNSLFIYKLLSVYFPEKFLPICTKKMMEPICNAMGIGGGETVRKPQVKF